MVDAVSTTVYTYTLGNSMRRYRMGNPHKTAFTSKRSRVARFHWAPAPPWVSSLLCTFALPAAVFSANLGEIPSHADGVPSSDLFVVSAPPSDSMRNSPTNSVNLAQSELSSVNPVAWTTKIQQFAQTFTLHATNDIARARSLYQAFLRPPRTGPTQFLGPLTAEEAFAAWQSPNVTLGCQDLSFLYVAAARAVGLKAFHVFVGEDCYGIKMMHACSAIFIGDKCLLVDLAYGIFGAKHKSFKVLNDTETIAIYLSGNEDFEKRRVASRLAPDLSVVQGSLFAAFAARNMWPEADELVEKLIRLDPDAQITYYARADRAAHVGDAESAIELIRKGIALAPETGILHFELGNLDADLGHIEDARSAYEQALRFAVNARSANAARQAITSTEALIEYSRGS